MDFPICMICHVKINIHGFVTPCCHQAIDEGCLHAFFPSKTNCPHCKHREFSSEEAIPLVQHMPGLDPNPPNGCFFVSTPSAPKLSQAQNTEVLAYPTAADRYTGEVHGTVPIPHGIGMCEYANGDKYTGIGVGKWVWTNGATYEGQRVAGKKQGKGKFVYVNGDVYRGDFVDDKREGRGVLEMSSTGMLYYGDWKNDLKDGTGTWERPDGAKYKGDWAEDLFHGNGVVYRDNGDVCYDGEFYRGKRHGNGTYMYPSGGWYHGNMVQSRREGRGFFVDVDGSTYDGMWLGDRRHGMGVQFDGEENLVYAGEWENDMPVI